MTITSASFLLFLAFACFGYYLVPMQRRWYILLLSSVVFYAIAAPKGLLYILATTLITHFIALWIQKDQDALQNALVSTSDKEAKRRLKSIYKKKKKGKLAIGLLVCFGLLAIIKYTNFVVLNLLSLFSREQLFHPLSFFIPMGLSFYTFSITSYLFDVYYAKTDAEKNPFKLLLFISWFPSMVQGPINRFGDLHQEFFKKEHPFDLTNFEFALQRILWGFIKKLVIADRAAQVVSYIFDEYAKLPNFIILFGLVMYSIQLYSDFAGGMDIALGVSSLFGIQLKENFRQPYFATSIADFWRRWHITLGSWMKDYIFYPFALSKTATNISKKLSKRSKYLSKVVPMALGNIIVFLLVGIWHGAEWHFVWYGLFHGGIIAFSVLMEPIYKKQIASLHIDTKSTGWHLFQIVRTFLLVNIGCLLDDVADMRQSWGMTKQLFDLTNWHLLANFSFKGFGRLTLLTVALFCLIWCILSIEKERGINVQQRIANLPVWIRWSLYLALIFAVPLFQSAHSAGFMYAQF